MNSFSDLGLIEPLQRAVREAGYTHPTPIQAQTIPHLLEGRDLLGCARTGTGKTAAFALPILQHLSKTAPRPAHPAPHASRQAHRPGRAVRALVLVPTRELAAQVSESFETYGRYVSPSVAVVYGGVGQGPQVRALTRGVDILVATPGRLLDLMEQGYVRLGQIEILVLDEADHMLDLGFIPDVRRILAAVPKRRQTLFFSATMPPPIARLADGILTNPLEVFVTPAASTVDEVEQRVHFIARSNKPLLLAQLLADTAVERALVFTRTKRGADRVTRRLEQDGIPAQAIHGNKAQGTRERTLKGFRDGRVRVLVATDIAARGLDIDDVSHVFNFELPNVPEIYVHRIGRTARAGSPGVAISLCDAEEFAQLRDIERLIRRKLEVAANPTLEHARHESSDGRHEHDGSTRTKHRARAARGHGKPLRKRGSGRSTRTARHVQHRSSSSKGGHAHSPKQASKHSPKQRDSTSSLDFGHGIGS